MKVCVYDRFEQCFENCFNCPQKKDYYCVFCGEKLDSEIDDMERLLCEQCVEKEKENDE